MTTVLFHTEGDRIVGFQMKGHSGLAPAGEDVLCAALTSAVRLIERTVNDVLGLGASVKVKENETSISLKLPGGLSNQDETTCQTLLTGFMVYLADLHEEYPAYLMVEEAE